MSEVTNRLGVPTRWAGSGVLRFEYELVDRSIVRIFPDKEHAAVPTGDWYGSSTVMGVEHVRGTETLSSLWRDRADVAHNPLQPLDERR